MGFLLCASIHATNFSPFPATGAALDAITLNSGDVVYDSTNKTLRTGDGTTLGGHKLATTTDTAPSVTGLTFASGKSLEVNNIITLAAGADSQTYTMPATSKTLMASDMSNSSIPICTSVDTSVTVDTPTANGYINISVGGNSYKVLVVTP